MQYKHTQIGYLMIFVLFLVAVLFTFIFTQEAQEPVTLVLLPVILLIIASFTTLTVTVNAEFVRIKFGWGIYSKRFALENITSVRTVRNRWYYGWGIRYWLWPRMVIFNISGFDAVELTMANGKIVRIGTDEPQKLERALQQNRKD